MNCTAKITDEFNGKYACCEEATDKLTITTFAPHLQRNIITIKYLCKSHLHSIKHRYNYKIKHCNKKTILEQEPLI